MGHQAGTALENQSTCAREAGVCAAALHSHGVLNRPTLAGNGDGQAGKDSKQGNFLIQETAIEVFYRQKSDECQLHRASAYIPAVLLETIGQMTSVGVVSGQRRMRRR